MKTELQKCIDGEWYDCHDKIFVQFKAKSRKLVSQYNTLPYENKNERYKLLLELLGSVVRMFPSVIPLYAIMVGISM